MAFCKDFNAKTSQLEKGSPIPVVITIYQEQVLHLRNAHAAGVLLHQEGRQVESGSKAPGRDKAGKITKEQVQEIAREEDGRS